AKACPGFDATSAASGEFAPNTLGTSGPVFSSTALAVATMPTSHPARVNATHGAGAFLPSAVSMLNVVSVGVVVLGSKIPSVQYANDTRGLLEPSGLKYRKLFETGTPMRSPYTPVRDIRIPVAVCAMSPVWSLVKSVPLLFMKLSSAGICSRSEGTLGL